MRRASMRCPLTAGWGPPPSGVKAKDWVQGEMGYWPTTESPRALCEPITQPGRKPPGRHPLGGDQAWSPEKAARGMIRAGILDLRFVD
jgi:hypothetical protein